MTRASRIALGEIGFERAAVWSAVGFALSYVAFEVIGLLTPIVGSPTGTAAAVGVLALLTAVGVVAFVAVGAGVFPAILLAYGPFAAVLLRIVGPEPYTIPFADPLPFAVGLVEPLGVALAGATAVGIAGYVAGRIGVGVLTDDGTETDSNPESPSEPATD